MCPLLALDIYSRGEGFTEVGRRECWNHRDSRVHDAFSEQVISGIDISSDLLQDGTELGTAIEGKGAAQVPGCGLPAVDD
jgi:hypothetical protein